jgi:anaerobic magnesium-protoporphyrin IX monomethyl ester cyclase
MKDLLLFVPLDDFAKAQYEFLPLGPLYLSSFLSKSGFDVDVVHGHVEDIKEGYKVYGVSTPTVQYSIAQRAAKRIRELQPGSTIVVGGPHFSSKHCIDLAVLDGLWDHIVSGDGEYALRDILAGKTSKTEQVIYGKMVESLDAMPLPDFDKIDIRKYNFPLRPHLKCVNVITSRGCPFSCLFCSNAKTKLRQRSPDNVAEELEVLTKRYGFDSVTFVDDTMSAGKSRYNKLLDVIEEASITWRSYSRTTTIDYVQLERMAEVENIESAPGIESGSQTILDLVMKGTNVEKNIAWCKRCEEVGIVCNPSLIIGLPGESPKTIQETQEFVERVRPKAFSYNILMPFPGSPIFREQEKYKDNISIYPYTWDDCMTKSKGITQSFVSTPTLTRDQILSEYYRNFEIFVGVTGFDPRKRGTRK